MDDNLVLKGVLSLKTAGIIPIKHLVLAKERLSTILSPPERKGLALSMLRDVLNSAISSHLNQIMIVGSDPIIQQIAKGAGAVFILDVGKGLNNALDDATRWCMTTGVDTVLILPADIPLITSKDINTIIRLAFEKSIVITPSKDNGTNALLRRPLKVIKTCFGPNSFHAHLHAARRTAVSIVLYGSPRVRFDVDSIPDLKTLLRVGRETISHGYLETIQIPDVI